MHLNTREKNQLKEKMKSIIVTSSLVAQTVNHLPEVRETRVQFLGWEDPLEKEMTIHSLEGSPRICGGEEGHPVGVTGGDRPFPQTWLGR